MSEAVIVALITAGTSILVQVLINRQNNLKNKVEQAKRDQKLDDRLEHIDEKLEEHNGYAKLFSEVSKSIVALQKDVEWMRGKM